MSTPAIIVHGGAGDWRPDEFNFDEVAEAAREAAAIGWELLRAGGSALDAVEKATNALEDHPLFDAGYGSFLNVLGEVEMDALIVDGRTVDFGAVAGVKHVQHPISLARRVMSDTRHKFFVGAGADRLAAQLGFPVIPNLHFVTDFELQRFLNREQSIAKITGTVGAVAIDQHGNIASATSTGGVSNKIPGRVGDSPLFGAGGYADNQFGAASATGVGENIMRVLLCKYVVDQLASGKTAQQGATASAHHINSRFTPSEAGIIVVDKNGQVGAAHTTRYMPIGWAIGDGPVHASMGGGISGLQKD